eukprot:766154-Hanusia_phi.AAC.11
MVPVLPIEGLHLPPSVLPGPVVPDVSGMEVQSALPRGLCVGVAGAAGAGLQTVFFSLSGQVGSTYTGAFMNGQAVA